MKKSYIMVVLLIAVTFANLAYAFSDQFQFACDDFPPFAYTENGKPTGLSVEILRTILNELQIPDTIKIYPWVRAYDMALKNKNTAVFTAARTLERETLFKWVGPIAPRKINLYKLKRRTDIKVSTFEDAKKYIVGTIRGYAAEKTLLNKGFEIGKNIDQVTRNIQNIIKIYRNRIDLMTSFDLLIVYTVKGTQYSFDDFEKVLVIDDKHDFYYAFNKETDDADVARFQQVLDNMKADGRYNNLLEKYTK